MSQQQPRRPQSEQAQMTEPIKYGDVLPVTGELAEKPVTPQDAALMQSAENLVLGQTQKGGPASVMQSAATKNEQASLVGRNSITDTARDDGVTVTEISIPGRRIITESIAGQVVGQYTEPSPVQMTNPSAVLDKDAITIGQALEAVAVSAGDKPVDRSDAAAIQAAEVRATGTNTITPGGVAATAQSAATRNDRTMDEGKTTLGDVLAKARQKLPSDKVATREDAEGIVSAEMRNNASMATHPGGVAEFVVTAARLNYENTIDANI